MTETPNPDWVAWLARAEAEEDIDQHPPPRADYTMAHAPVPGWIRLADLLPKIVAGAIGGSVPLILAGMALYFSRVPW